MDVIIEKKILSKLPENLIESEVLSVIHDDYLNPPGIRSRVLRKPIEKSNSQGIGKR